MATGSLYPLPMRPKLVVKVWGGRKLADHFQKELPDDGQPYGESWEIADLSQGQSVVASGPLQGLSLQEVGQRLGADLLGAHRAFPLLVKLLDAQRDLSLQVHPGRADLDDLPAGAQSKDESWLILGAEPGACVLHGFKEGCRREDFERALQRGAPLEVMRRVEVQPGQVLRVAPGTVHAICEGVVLLEIQQPSDTTYRVWDYARPGLDGQLRELHLEQAMQVARFGPQPEVFSVSEAMETIEGMDRALLVQAPGAYRIESITGRGRLLLGATPGHPRVVFATERALQLGEQQLAPWTAAVLPAALGQIELELDGRVILAGVNSALGAISAPS